MSKWAAAIARKISCKICYFHFLFFSEMQELLPEVNTILENGSKCTEPPVENVDSQLLAVPEIVNVTVPIQCLVEEESRLILYEGSKSGLAGF